MDTNDKIREIRTEFKEYLTNEHPDWTEITVNTRVSDAFYIWNNTVMPGFWKVFDSDKSMADAKENIRDYLKNEVKSDRYEERTRSYFRELSLLKDFFDSKYGGVANRIGYEFDAEERIYEVCKKYYDGAVSEEEALDELCEKVPYYNRVSHKMCLLLFSCMMEGRRYSRRANIEGTLCLIRNIGRDYGKENMEKALISTRENIIYYYNGTSNKSNCMRRYCQKLADENDIKKNCLFVFDML